MCTFARFQVLICRTVPYGNLIPISRCYFVYITCLTLTVQHAYGPVRAVIANVMCRVTIRIRMTMYHNINIELAIILQYAHIKRCYAVSALIDMQ
jgi:hypothetical protein